MHVFEIRDLKPSDAGEWRSLAFNSYGQTLCSCTIKVIGTLKILLEVSTLYLTMRVEVVFPILTLQKDVLCQLQKAVSDLTSGTQVEKF